MIWLVAALALAVLVLGVLTVGVWMRLSRLRRGIEHLHEDRQRHATTLLALHGAMKAIADDVITQGQRQTNLRRTLERLADQHSELRLRDAAEGAYAQAIQLIGQGRNREEVRVLCALTQSELDLLFTLHGHGVGRRQEHAPPPDGPF